MKMPRLSLILVSVLFAAATQGAEMEKTRASDFGLHGPVKQCIERTTYPASPGTVEHSSVVTTNFSPDGWLLDMRSESGAGFPAYVTTYSHNEAGRLTKKTFGMEGGREFRGELCV